MLGRMSIPVVWSPETRRHEPMREVWVGVPTEGTEVPERVDRILTALAGHEVVEATSYDDDVLLRVHDAALVEHLRTDPRRVDVRSVRRAGRAGPGGALRLPDAAMTQGMPVTRPRSPSTGGPASSATTR